MRTATLSFLCLLGAACSGASNPLAGELDSGTTGHGDSGSSSGGGSGSGSGGGSGGGMPEGGGTCSPTPPDGGACNSLEPEGALVPYVCLGGGMMPTPIGGTIVDGKYVLMSSVYYGTTCPQSEEDRDTWYVCGTDWQHVQENTLGTGTPTVNTYDASVTPTGPASLSLQFTCGATLTIPFQYDATPTRLMLYVGGGRDGAGSGRVDTYAKQ